MAVEYKFGGRYKVIKGETYPIKRADLERALEEAGVTDLEEISYVSVKSASSKGDPVASIWMTGEAIIPGMWMKRSPSLIVSSIPVEVSQEIKELIEKENILGKMALWLRELEKAENVRRSQSQSFRIYYREGKLVIEATK
ncbi:hypothetical protein [Pseudodesulfovibrio sp.]|uniref:hypothetical protein n=1 Tax=Pseudodesulfovibrio sp. TaxID=2035812 RepID=UPI00263327F9|nr:hypothetical protein [Pseudodesulfovibrio sp.]MDD3312539.1 hypothetical protein [Pseudodesulfovibrio sp.]